MEAITPSKHHVHLTANELHGLRAIVLYLHSLAPTRKNVPELLVNPVALIQDVRTLVEQHRKDQTHLAISGVPVVKIQQFANSKSKKVHSTPSAVATKIEPIAATSSRAPVLQSTQASTSSHVSVIVKRDPIPEIKAEAIVKRETQTIIKKEELVEIKKEETTEHENVELESDGKFPLSTVESPFRNLRDQLRQQQEAAMKLRQSVTAARPATVGPVDSFTQRKKASGILLSQMSEKLELILRPEVLLPVFQYLSIADLLMCMRVCRSWNRYSIDPSLWKVMDLSHRQLTQIMLAGIIRRQPKCLLMDWSSFSHSQCAWLMDRLPHLSTLSIQGCSAAVISALKLPSVSPTAFSRAPLPKLTVLDLSWVSGLNDILIEKSILSATSHRLSNLKQLALAGSQLTDVSLAAFTSVLPSLECLCLAYCLRFSSHGLRSLLDTSNGQLQRIDLMGCTQLSSIDYPALRRELCSSNSRLCLPEDITSDSQPIHRCVRLN